MKRIISAGLICCLLLALTACGGAPLDQVFDLIGKNFAAIDEMQSIYQEAIADCREFNSGSFGKYELADRLRDASERIGNVEVFIAPDELKQQTQDDKKIAEPLTIGEIAQTHRDYLIGELEYLGDFLPVSRQFKTEEQLNVYVEIPEQNAALFVELYWIETNSAMVNYANSKEAKAFCSSMAELNSFSEWAGSWSTEKERLTAFKETRYTAIQDNIAQLSCLTGEDTLEVDQMRIDEAIAHDDMVRVLTNNYGYSEENAEKLWQIYQKKCELARLEKDLEEAHQAIRDKFAPSAEDEAAVLLGKAAHFAAAKMYPESVECLDVLLAKPEDPECPLICAQTAREFYQEAAEGGINYGILVTIPEREGYYQPGDIIIEVDGTVIYNATSWINTSGLREDGFTAAVLRMNENGSLEKVSIQVPEGEGVAFSGMIVNDSQDFPVE